MTDASLILIDHDAIAGNLRAVRSVVGEGVRLCPIVKADAYGLGAPAVARTLSGAGADLLAVYSLDQAALVDAAAGMTPILVLMPVRSVPRAGVNARRLRAGGLHLSVHGVDQLEELRSSAPSGVVVPVHLEVDVGMGRGGMAPDDLPLALERVAGDPRFRVVAVYSHLSDGADPACVRAQSSLLDAAIEAAIRADLVPEDLLVHLASTSSLVREPFTRRDMVRFGLAWSGARGGMVDVPEDEATEAFRPAIEWRSWIVHARRVPAGHSVGYGSLWRAPDATRIGLVPVGYGDGVPSTLVDRADPLLARVLVRDAPPLATRVARRFDDDGPIVPIVGAISMDQIVVDLGALDASVTPTGLEIRLIEPDSSSPLSLERQAARAGVVPHELLTRIGARGRRVHLGLHGGASAAESTRRATAASTIEPASPGQRASTRSTGIG